jgi:hypothetical protein
MFKSFKTVAVAAFAGILGLGAVAHADTVLTNGECWGGWTITCPVGITLVADSAKNDYSELDLEKTAVFSHDKGLIISFVQTGKTAAAPKIVIEDESVVNKTGTNWGEFQMLLTSPDAGGPGAPAAAAFQGPAYDNDDLGQFTKSSLTANDYSLTGGVVKNGATMDIGSNSDNSLTIDANPGIPPSDQAFFLKEVPTVAAIPLPAAAWSGLSGLIGLGVMAHAKKLKKILA